MSVASKLYQLQTTEQKLRETRQVLKATASRLERNEALEAAQKELSSLQTERDARRKAQRDLDWDVEQLTAKIKDVNDQLYGGKVRNPKELVNLEQDLRSLKRHLAEKEDLLLEAMALTEGAEDRAVAVEEEATGILNAWEREKPQLEQAKAEAEVSLARLTRERETLRAGIDPSTAGLYDSIHRSSGLAVVKVEQGRCRGCNLTVPSGQWQRARSGELVQCGSCGRILYVE